MPSATHERIQKLESDITEAKRAYVRRFGWKETCNTPGSYWLWQRDFAKEDAERHAMWKERGPGPLGPSSELKPQGRITATLDMAVGMTLATLDEDEEELVDG